MNPLQANYRTDITLNLEKVNTCIERIKSSKSLNDIVSETDWFHPRKVGSGAVDELVYYGIIKEALEIGLEKGRIPLQYEPYFNKTPKAPLSIRKLLK